MKDELTNEELMDVIMSYDRYIQDFFDSHYVIDSRPLTIAQFYDELYSFYSYSNQSKYVC